MSISTLQYKKNMYLLILVALLTPTFFIHTVSYPDWGDDFAQYVYQSQQINSPSDDYKLVLNVNEYSSPKRSVFFSIVLSVITPTTLIANYVNLISILYILAGVCVFLFFTRFFSQLISLLSSLCVSYNFLFLRLKSEIVPEFLFISLFYIILYLLFSPKKKFHTYIIPLFLGLLVSVRFIGLSLLLTYIVYLLVQDNKSFKQKLHEMLICFSVFIVVILCINTCFLSSINNQEIDLYGGAVLKYYNFNTLFENINIYTRYSLLFFEQEIPFWINMILKISVTICFFIGLVYSIKKRLHVINIAFGFYLLFIFIYPYNGDTIKYLIPIFPLILFYIINGGNKLIELAKLSLKKQLIIGAISVILLSNSKTVLLSIQQVSTTIGPYNQSIINDFNKVKQVVNPNENIAFAKPFVINLLCDRYSYFLNEQNHKTLLLKANYFLIPKQSIDELYFKSKHINVQNADTIELENFYLLGLKKRK